MVTPISSRISRTLVLYIVLFSSVITIVLTAMQLYLDYRQGIRVINQTLDQVELSTLDSLTQAAWTLDNAAIETQLDGLVRLNDIIYVALLDENSNVLAAVGEVDTDQIIQKQFKMHYQYRGMELLIGLINIVATKQKVYRQLLDTFLIILITQAIKTFMVSLFILLLFQHFVTKHLSNISGFLNRIDPTNTPEKLFLKRDVSDKKQADELDVVVESVNQMTDKIYDYYTELTRRQAVLEHLANFDSLTGLPNRFRLHEVLDDLISNAGQTQKSFAVAIMDLDGFKNVNDTFGHHSGDKILQKIQPRLSLCMKSKELLARLGGDEFSMIFTEYPDHGDLEARLKNIREVIAEPYSLMGLEVLLSASIGISLFPEHGENSSDLLRMADVAMYKAKLNRLGYYIYDPGLDSQSRRKFALTNDLNRAIQEKELVLHYQPKINLSNGSCESIEALIRWQHPEYGLIMPDEFIHIAELSEQINPMTLWVVEQGLRDIDNLSQVAPGLSLSINICTRNLLANQFCSELVNLVNSKEIAPDRITLEITERSIMENPDTNQAHISQLAREGFKISIDDFGTGYSSLSLLAMLEVHELKIDKTFVQDMTNYDEQLKIVRSTIDLAHNLGLMVTAEGVEEQVEYNMLKSLNCDQVQGYLIAKPLPINELFEWIRQDQNRIR